MGHVQVIGPHRAEGTSSREDAVLHQYQRPFVHFHHKKLFETNKTVTMATMYIFLQPCKMDQNKKSLGNAQWGASRRGETGRVRVVTSCSLRLQTPGTNARAPRPPEVRMAPQRDAGDGSRAPEAQVLPRAAHSPPCPGPGLPVTPAGRGPALRSCPFTTSIGSARPRPARCGRTVEPGGN